MKIFRNEISLKNPYPCETGRNLFDSKSWPFLLEDRFTYVDKLEDADIIILNDAFDLTKIYKKIKRKQICLSLYIFHIDDHFDENLFRSGYKAECERYPNINLIFLHKNKLIPDQEGMLYYDSMFNRHKLYFQDYHKIEKWKQNFQTPGDFTQTVGTNKDTFTLNKLEKDFSEGFRNILSPSLIYHDFIPARMRFRAGLKGWLNLKCKGNAFTNEDGYMYPNNPSPHILKRFNSDKKDGGFWYPLADKYYHKSLFSVYVETLTMSGHDTRCVTEKTFDPLIKGNFVIPFSYPGFISDLEKYGFVIPSGIDVDYDKIENDEVRFQFFLNSVKFIGNMTVDECKKVYQSNKHIFEHNRNVFFSRPYHTMYDRLLERLNVIKNKAGVSNL